MSSPQAPVQRDTSPEVARVSDLHMHRMQLVIARVLWCSILGLVLGIIIASTPTYFAYLHVLAPRIVPREVRLTQDGVRALQALHLTLDFYAVFNIVLNTLFMLGFVLVGAVLFWRKAE